MIRPFELHVGTFDPVCTGRTRIEDLAWPTVGGASDAARNKDTAIRQQRSRELFGASILQIGQVFPHGTWNRQIDPLRTLLYARNVAADPIHDWFVIGR